MVILVDKTIGLLYGRGAGHSYLPDHVMSARFNYGYLIKV